MNNLNLPQPVYEEVAVAEVPQANPEEKQQKPSRRDSYFRFRLTFEGNQVEGTGKTKQKAKHDAAEVIADLYFCIGYNHCTAGTRLGFT